MKADFCLLKEEFGLKNMNTSNMLGTNPGD